MADTYHGKMREQRGHMEVRRYRLPAAQVCMVIKDKRMTVVGELLVMGEGKLPLEEDITMLEGLWQEEAEAERPSSMVPDLDPDVTPPSKSTRELFAVLKGEPQNE